MLQRSFHDYIISCLAILILVKIYTMISVTLTIAIFIVGIFFAISFIALIQDTKRKTIKILSSDKISLSAKQREKFITFIQEIDSAPKPDKILFMLELIVLSPFLVLIIIFLLFFK